MGADTGIGAALSAAREAKGVDMADVARSTKIRTDYLKALEAEEFERIGGDVYAKGFLKTYAVALGLDPEELLAIYRKQVQGGSSQLSGSLAQAPVAREPRGAPPMLVVWGVAAFVVLIGIVAIANLVGGGRTPEPAIQARPPAAATPTPTPTPTVEATPTPSEVVYDGVEIVLTFEQDSWVRVRLDGELEQEGVVRAGEVLTFKGTDLVTVRYGNAGGVTVTVNGKDLGVVGERGRVEERRYDANGEVAGP